MSNALSSKVIIQEEEPRVRSIQGIATAVAGAIGVTDRGPIGEPVLVTSFEEFQNKFGGFTKDSDLSLAVMGFFQNGGNQLHVVRTVHYDDVSKPKSYAAKPAGGKLIAHGSAVAASVPGSVADAFHLQDGDKLIISVDGSDPATEAEFRGIPASVSNAEPGPYSLNHGDTLTMELEDGREQTITFSADDFADIGAATEQEIAAVINRQIYGGKAEVVEVPA